MINFYQTLKALDTYKKIVIRDLLCVEYKCLLEDQNFKFWTDVGCLVYCTSGMKIYSSKNEDFKVKEGSVFFMKKGAYSGESFFDEDYCALLLFLPGSYIKHFMSKYEHLDMSSVNRGISYISTGNFIPLSMDAGFEGYLYSVLSYFASTDEVNQELLEIKFDELLLNIFTQPHFSALSEYLMSLTNDPRVCMRQIMEENFTSSMNLAEYAKLCNMSLSTFKREFFSTYGMSPGRWLRKRRLQFAKKLIENSNFSINEIAIRCGFDSDSHFIRTFRKYENTTPARFRMLNGI